MPLNNWLENNKDISIWKENKLLRIQIVLGQENGLTV